MFIFCGKFGHSDPNISYCDINILFIDANIVLMFVRVLLKWEFYVNIYFNDVCIVFDQVDIVIEHIYGLGVLLWKWHKHVTSWCIHIILRCKDYGIVCCLCTDNCWYIHTFVLSMSTLHLKLFTLSFGFLTWKRKCVVSIKTSWNVMFASIVLLCTLSLQICSIVITTLLVFTYILTMFTLFLDHFTLTKGIIAYATKCNVCDV